VAEEQAEAHMAERNGKPQVEKVVAYVNADLEDLIPEYLENKREEADIIRQALNAEDYETIGVLGHNMKGSGGGYGFDMITDIGSAIESAAKEKDFERIRKSIDDLLIYLERVDIVIVDE
jgi:HPt (histidine-containing phosphotransfer) domain-containing protein